MRRSRSAAASPPGPPLPTIPTDCALVPGVGWTQPISKAVSVMAFFDRPMVTAPCLDCSRTQLPSTEAVLQGRSGRRSRGRYWSRRQAREASSRSALGGQLRAGGNVVLERQMNLAEGYAISEQRLDCSTVLAEANRA